MRPFFTPSEIDHPWRQTWALVAVAVWVMVLVALVVSWL